VTPARGSRRRERCWRAGSNRWRPLRH